MYWVGVNMFCMVVVTSGQHVCDNSHSVYRIPGDAIITGFFGAHSGINCTVPEPGGMQLMQSTITAVEAIRNNNLVPGVHIGLSLYDTCSQEEMAQKSIVSAMVDAECKQEYVMGGVTEETTGDHVEELSQSLVLPMTRVGGSDGSLLASIAARLVAGLKWNPVDYVLSTKQYLAQIFQIEASTHDICIHHIDSNLQMGKLKTEGVVVVFAEFEEIKIIVQSITFTKLILVPIDGHYTPISVPNAKSRVVVLLPTTLAMTIRGIENNNTELDLLTQSKATLLQVQILSDLLKVVGMLRSKLATYCSGDTEWTICPKLPRISVNSSHTIDITHNTKLIVSALNVLHVAVDQFEGFVVLEQKGENLKRIGRVGLEEMEWEVILSDKNATILSTDGNTWRCNDTESCGHCVNRDLLLREPELDEGSGGGYMTGVTIKSEAWVAALLTVSTVGILSCITIAVFILIRICKKDILEGNPAFSFLMLISTIFMYSSVIPFCIEVTDDHHYYSGLLCGLKVFVTSLSYSLVFSVMLARSLMLASCDRDGGLMSHVNGYLQTSLCFFIALVQVALTLQFCAVNWLLLSKEQCEAMSHGLLFLVLLAYNAFLLLLLICVTPLIVRSKRNYREGIYFVVASWLCCLVWGGWTSLYWLGGETWREVAVCSGLVSTATIILIAVFIPRTYLMLSGIVRDHIVSTLPSLAHTTSTSVVDVNYRSTQALYDSVTAHRHNPRGHVNPNFYSGGEHNRATTPSTSRVESRSAHNKTPDNTYERYDTPPSPHNVTRF